MRSVPSPGYSLTIRARYQNQVGMLGMITSAIGGAGGDISAIDIVEAGGGFITRDITINVQDSAHAQHCVEVVRGIPKLRVINVSDRVFLLHLGGKLEIAPRVPVKTRDDLMTAYLPGSNRIASAILQDPEKVFTLTVKRNLIAVVSNGGSVPALGKIGPEAAIPINEGRALLFKELAAVDAFPICVDAADADSLVAAVRAIAPVFGAIDLEDLEENTCFEIEQKLQAGLDIPVIQGSLHGAAVVVLAGLINASRLMERGLEQMKVVVEGSGSVATVCVRLLRSVGIHDIAICDSAGALSRDAPLDTTGTDQPKGDPTSGAVTGSLAEALKGADAFVGMTGEGTLTLEMVGSMGSDPIVFMLDSYSTDLAPEELQSVARVVATGRSDYPNQLNNVLCFPGLFRGLLDSRASGISEGMIQAAARTIADIVHPHDLNEEYILPSVFDKRVVPAVARAVALDAEHSGLARRLARPGQP